MDLKIKDLNLKVGQIISRKKIVNINKHFVYLECVGCGIKASIYLDKDESCLYEHSKPDKFCRTGCLVCHKEKNIDFIKGLKNNDILFDKFKILCINKNFGLRLECIECGQVVSINSDHKDILNYTNKGSPPITLSPDGFCCAIAQEKAHLKTLETLQKKRIEEWQNYHEEREQLRIKDNDNKTVKRGSSVFYLWRGEEISIDLLADTNGIPVGTIRKNMSKGCTVTEAVSINGFVGEDILKIAEKEGLDFDLLKKLIRNGLDLDEAAETLSKKAIDSLFVLLIDPETR